MAAVAEAQVPTTTTSGSTTPESSAQTPLTPQQKLQQAKDARDQAKKSGDKEALKAAKDQVKQARAEVKNPLLNDDRYLELHRQVAVGREQMRHEQPVVLTILKSPAEAILYRRTVDRLWQAMQSNPNLGDPPLVTTDMVREASRRGKVAFNELTLRDQAKAVNAREQLRKIAQEAGMDPVAEAVKSDPAAKAFLEGIQQKVLGQELNADLIRDYKIGEVSEQDRADRYAREIKALSDANGQNLDDAGARQLAEGLIIMAQGMREAGFVMHDNIRSDATELAFKDMLQKNLTPEQRLLYQQLVGVSESRSVIAKLQGGKAVGLMGAGFVTGLMHVPGVNAGVLLAGGAAMGVWSAYKRVQYDELMYKINESRGIHKETGDRNLLQKAFSADWNSIDTSHDRKIAYARIITTSALVSVASFGLGRFIHNPDDFVQWIHQSYEGIKDTAGNLIHGMDATQHITLSSMPQTTEAGMFGTPAMPNTMKGFLDTFTGHTGTRGNVDTSHLTTGGSGEATQSAVQQAGHLDTNHLTAVTAHGPAIPKVVDHPGPHQGQVDQYLLDRQRAIVDAQHANAAHLQSVDQQNDLRFAEGDKPITLKTFDADLTKFQHETDPIKLNADWMRLQADVNMLHNPQLTQHFNDLLANPAAKGTLTAEDFIKLHQEVSFLEDQPILHNISADIAKLQAAMDAHDFKTQDSILEQIREQARQLHDSQQKTDILNQINAIKRPSSLWPDRLPTNADIQHLKADVAALEPQNSPAPSQGGFLVPPEGPGAGAPQWSANLPFNIRWNNDTPIAGGIGDFLKNMGVGADQHAASGAAGAATAAGQHTTDTAANTLPNGTGGSTNAHELFGQPTGHENVVYEGNQHNPADFAHPPHYGTDATDARIGTWQGAHTAYDANGKWVEFYGSKPGSVMEIHMNGHVYTFPSGMKMSLTDNDPSHGVTLTPVGGGPVVHMTQQQFLTMVGYGDPKTIQAGNIVNATYQEWAKLHGIAGTGNASDRLAQAVDPAWLARHPGFAQMLDHNLKAHNLSTHDIHWTAVKMGEGHLDGDTIKIDAENQDVDQSQFQNNLPAAGTGGGLNEAGENFTGAAQNFDNGTDWVAEHLPFGWGEGFDNGTDELAKAMQWIEGTGIAPAIAAAILIGTNIRSFAIGSRQQREGVSFPRALGTVAEGAGVQTALSMFLSMNPIPLLPGTNLLSYLAGRGYARIRYGRTPAAPPTITNVPTVPLAPGAPGAPAAGGGIPVAHPYTPSPAATVMNNPPRGLLGRGINVPAFNQQMAQALNNGRPAAQQVTPPAVGHAFDAAVAGRETFDRTHGHLQDAALDIINANRAGGIDLTDETNANFAVDAMRLTDPNAQAAMRDAIRRAAIADVVANDTSVAAPDKIKTAMDRMHAEVDGITAGNAPTPEQLMLDVYALTRAYPGRQADIQTVVDGIGGLSSAAKVVAAAELAAGNGQAKVAAAYQHAFPGGPSSFSPVEAADTANALMNIFSQNDHLGADRQAIANNINGAMHTLGIPAATGARVAATVEPGPVGGTPDQVNAAKVNAAAKWVRISRAGNPNPGDMYHVATQLQAMNLPGITSRDYMRELHTTAVAAGIPAFNTTGNQELLVDAIFDPAPTAGEKLQNALGAVHLSATPTTTEINNLGDLLAEARGVLSANNNDLATAIGRFNYTELPADSRRDVLNRMLVDPQIAALTPEEQVQTGLAIAGIPHLTAARPLTSEEAGAIVEIGDELLNNGTTAGVDVAEYIGTEIGVSQDNFAQVGDEMVAYQKAAGETDEVAMQRALAIAIPKSATLTESAAIAKDIFDASRNAATKIPARDIAEVATAVVAVTPDKAKQAALAAAIVIPTGVNTVAHDVIGAIAPPTTHPNDVASVAAGLIQSGQPENEIRQALAAYPDKYYLVEGALHVAPTHGFTTPDDQAQFAATVSAPQTEADFETVARAMDTSGVPAANMRAALEPAAATLSPADHDTLTDNMLAYKLPAGLHTDPEINVAIQFVLGANGYPATIPPASKPALRQRMANYLVAQGIKANQADADALVLSAIP